MAGAVRSSSLGSGFVVGPRARRFDYRLNLSTYLVTSKEKLNGLDYFARVIAEVESEELARVLVGHLRATSG